MKITGKTRLEARLTAHAVALLLFMASPGSHAEDSANAAGAPPSSPKSVQVGELRFQVTSLRVSVPQPHSGDSEATLSIVIENTGPRPIALDYQGGTGNVTDDHGYKYPEFASREEVSGLPRAEGQHADVSMVIDPGTHVGAQLRFVRFLRDGQTVGTVYDFAAEFASYEDLGQGRIRKVRTYPVTMTNLQRAPILSGTLSDSAGKITNAISGFFKRP